MRRNALAVIALSLSLTTWSACSTQQYRYVPAEHQVGTDDGKSEALYGVPKENAVGKARIRSMGIVDVKPKDSNKTFHALNLRLAISNQSKDQTWLLDVQKQAVSFPNDGQIHATFANTDSATIPVLEIKPGELKTVDLFFELPPSQQSAKEIPVFDFTWSLRLGTRLYTETTPFDREPVPVQPAVVYPYAAYPYFTGWGPMGWGPVWWGGFRYHIR